MLTPAFKITQDADMITLIIKAPHAKVSETEIHIDGTDFRFYSSPYYLRINLPASIVEDSREKASYDADTGQFTVVVPKETPGQHFEGLDLQTMLLSPPGQRSAKSPLIEVIDDSPAVAESMNAGDVEDEDFDWFMEQVPQKDEELSLELPKYGFANRRSGVFQQLQAELCDVIDLQDADSTPASQRLQLQRDDEKGKFDENHYLADLFEDEAVSEVMNYEPPWVKEYKKYTAGEHLEQIVKFSEEEQEAMRKLPRKEYLIDSQEELGAYLSLVDIIYAYAYNVRTTMGENTVESGWTVCKLCSTLSWLQTYSNLRDVAVLCIRRTLCYPLYRHWKLARRILRDTHKILSLGKRRVLRCLLEVHKLLSEGESRYILNDLYITDYCVWIQYVGDKRLKSLAESLKQLEIKKKDLDLDLCDLEAAALLAVEESEETNQITEAMEHVTLGTNES